MPDTVTCWPDPPVDGLSEERSGVVPVAAVLKDGDKMVVFVVSGSDYQKRGVTTGIQGSDRVEIVDGLNEGDKVVVKGNYLLLQQSRPEQK